MDFDFLQTSHLFSVPSLKQSSRLEFRIATKGACRKKCSSKFRKIHLKAPVSELFLMKRRLLQRCFHGNFAKFPKHLLTKLLLIYNSSEKRTLREVFSYEFCEMFRTAILWNTCEILLFFIYKNIYLSRT